MSSGSESLRSCAEELVKKASEAGIENTCSLLRMTPREIRAEFASAAARRRLALENADLQAWLTGRYVLMAMHAPRRYPRKSNGLCRQIRPMTDEQMKQAFVSMAEERRERNGGS